MPGTDKINRARLDRAVRDARVTLSKLVRAGVTVGTGTDVWQLPTAVHLELEEFVASGLPPAEAIRAATSSAARIIGVSNDLGSVEPGKWADLVIVDADPLADIRNTRRISAVLQGGRVVDRAAIRGSFESPGTPSPGESRSYSATQRRRGAASMIGQTMTSNHASRRRRVVLHTTPFRVTCVCVGGELRFARRAGHGRFEHGAHRRVAAPHAGLATLANLM
jgi:hypothetical protein